MCFAWIRRWAVSKNYFALLCFSNVDKSNRSNLKIICKSILNTKKQKQVNLVRIETSYAHISSFNKPNLSWYHQLTPHYLAKSCESIRQHHNHNNWGSFIYSDTFVQAHPNTKEHAKSESLWDAILDFLIIYFACLNALLYKKHFCFCNKART